MSGMKYAIRALTSASTNGSMRWKALKAFRKIPHDKDHMGWQYENHCMDHVHCYTHLAVQVKLLLKVEQRGLKSRANLPQCIMPLEMTWSCLETTFPNKLTYLVREPNQ